MNPLMFIDEQLEIVLDPLETSSPVTKYYSPVCASCPMCSGGNTLRFREDMESNSTYSYMVCVNCGTGGTGKEWVIMLESEYKPAPNRHNYLHQIYVDTFSDFKSNYHKCRSMMKNLDYLSDELPPAKAFSIIAGEKIENYISTKSRLRERDFYVVIPLYRHVGLMDDFLLFDGDFFDRLYKPGRSDYVSGGFCGNLLEPYMKELFIAPSPRDMIKILGRQKRENVPQEMLPIIVDMSRDIYAQRYAGTIHPAKIRSDKIYYLMSEKTMADDIMHYPEQASGEVKVIKNYEHYKIAEIAGSADKIAKKTTNRPYSQTQETLDQHKYPYRFIVDEPYVYGYRHRLNLEGWAPKDRESKIQRIVNGLIYTEHNKKDDTYKIITRYMNDKKMVYKDVPRDIFMNRDSINAYLEQNKDKSGNRDKKAVSLLEWFDSHDILPDLIMISQKTAEVLNKNKEA